MRNYIVAIMFISIILLIAGLYFMFTVNSNLFVVFFMSGLLTTWLALYLDNRENKRKYDPYQGKSLQELKDMLEDYDG